LGSRVGPSLIGELRMRLELPRKSLVELAPLADREVALDELAEELMTEPMSAVRQRSKNTVDARLAQGGADLTGRSADERTDQAFVDRFARHREDPDDRERLRVEAGDPGQEQVDQRWRASEGGGRIRTRSQKLLREERMAFGAAPDGSEELVGDRALVHRHELAAHLVLGEPPELDPDRSGRTPQLGQPGADRMAGREVVGSAGQDRDQSLFRDVADEECHEVACRGIDPLDVLEDREHRLFLAEPLEESEEALEQPGT